MRYEHITLVNRDLKIIHTYKKDNKIISKQLFYSAITNSNYKITVLEYTKKYIDCIENIQVFNIDTSIIK